MTYILPAHLRIGEVMAALSKELNRPVYLSSWTSGGADCLYKMPGASIYKPLSDIERFIMPLTDHGMCRAMGDENGKKEGGKFRLFDLEPAEKVFLMVPVEPWEEKNIRWNAANAVTHALGQYGLKVSDGTYVSANKAPEELVSRIRSVKMGYSTTSPYRDMVGFYKSYEMINPEVHQPSWELRHLKMTEDMLKGNGAYFHGGFMEPPGHYPEKHEPRPDNDRRFGIVTAASDLCTVCRGASGNMKHLVIVEYQSALHHLCKTCAIEAFKQWTLLLEQDD